MDKKSNTPVSRYLSLPYYPYTPNPGYTTEAVVQHNEQGYRGAPVPVMKGEKFRVLCLGGSTTYGTVVKTPEQTYPAQLEKILNQWHLSGKLRLTEKGVEVINGGVEAATSAEELTHYLFKFRYYQPDLIIIHSGGNDAMIDPAQPEFQPDYSHYRRLRFHLEPLPGKSGWLLNSYFLSFLTVHFFYSDFASQNHYFSHTGNQQYIKWMDNSIFTNPDFEQEEYNFYPFFRNHATLIQAAKADECTIINITFALNPNDEWVVSNELFRKQNSLNNEIIEKLSRQNNIHFIPYHYDSISSASYWLDDCHLSAEGEMEKAMMVANKIFMIYQ